jgi:diguanylate cyclase (GGDEF)-like protein
MSSPADMSLLADIALPMRLAAACAGLWFGALLALALAQRTDTADARVQRSWLITAAIIVGGCSWSGVLCIAMGLAGSNHVPLLGSALALSLAIGASLVAFAGALSRRKRHRPPAAAGAGLLTLAQVAALAQSMDWKLPLAAVVTVALVAVASQVATVWTLAYWQRRQQASPWKRSATVALPFGLLQGLPVIVLTAFVPMPGPVEPAGELLLVLLASGMSMLALQAWRMERRMVGRHQLLGAQLQQAHAHLERTPYSDPLTGLLSRVGLEGSLRTAAASAENQGSRLALLVIGLDGFKSVNDSFGHALGDSVLREVGRRLVAHASSLVAPPRINAHNLARLGGDEFVLMLQGHLDRQSLGRAAAKLLEVLDGPIDCDGHELKLSASIGIACFPEDGGASKLIARANAAMQAAKAAGGSTYMAFEARMQDDARDKHELLRDLRHAIENKQLELFYQPKIDARSGQVTAAEALLRWHHPARGTLSPDVFIPLAERHGLIGALGNWVIEDACRQAKVWRERGLKMRVAINLSVFQMRQNDLVERIQAALKRHGVNPSRLTCEITESVAMEDTQVTQRTFERLGQAGIHLSIDDFGTGYSSLSYLRRLPATELKIDRSFVMDLDTNEDARAIVDAVLKLAHAIGLKVVAEGVETIRQRDILLGMGCDEFQGYLFARPMSARALMLWAVDDKPAKNAFRASLFAETDTDMSTMDGGARSSSHDGLHSVQTLRARRRHRGTAGA